MSLASTVRRGLLVAALGTVPLSTLYSYFVPDKVVTRIVDAQVKRYGDSDKYLIFTDSEVFENTDAWYRFKFNSSDVQRDAANLKGKTAEIKKYGWRFRPLSWYENVLSIRPLE